MFELGFSLTTDNYRAYWWVNVIRQVLSMLDRVVYNLIVIAYEILFNIADTKIFSSEMVSEFYDRVQLIIGVFMIFKLAVSLLKIIINPDTLTDKESGFGKIITRIVIMLAMFVAIRPLNIPATEGTYNAYLNESGLLFGTMYYFQSRVLDNNVLGKLIIGSSYSSNKNDEEEESINNLKSNQSGLNAADAGKNLASYVLKGFVRINLKEQEETEISNEVDENDESNYMCPIDEVDTGDDDVYDVYKSPSVSPNQILDRINAACNTGGVWVIDFDGPSRYALSYMPFVSTAVGVLVLLMLVSYCVEIAIRAIKLAILRLLAPIPIISYVDPKSAKGGAFSSWTKILATTYIDLFIRLSIIYFIISLISQIVNGSLDLPISNGVIGAISTIFIIIGLFFFAKQAPKFIKDALGIKSEGGSGLFSGLGKIAGFGATAAGAIGSARTNYRASKEENGTGGFFNNARNMGTGLLGGISGAKAGYSAASSAKDHQADAAMKAMNERNARRAAHITAGGRMNNNLSRLFSGRSLAEKDEDLLTDLKDKLAPIDRNSKANQSALSAMSKFKQTAEEQAIKSDSAVGNLKINGKSLMFNYSQLQGAMAAKDDKGNFNYNNEKYNVESFDPNTMEKLKKSQTEYYVASNEASTDNKLIGAQNSAIYHAKEAGINYDGSYNTVGSAIGDANNNILETQKSIDEINRNITNIQESTAYRSHKRNANGK